MLALYAEQGEGMLAHLRGMFAFALWDAEERCLFLARDAYGIKPLYYADDGRTLRLASQVQALRAGGAVDTAADVAALAGFYLFGTVPEPLTAMRTVRALPAGSWLRVRDRGVEGPTRWHGLSAAWRAAVTVSEQGSTAGDEVASQIAEALRDSVRHHLVADVAVGAFLSSGIDSGALVGLMAEAGQAPQTLTVAFEEFRGLPQDESPLAAEVAAHYGCSHRVLMVNESGFRDDWPRILAALAGAGRACAGAGGWCAPAGRARAWRSPGLAALAQGAESARIRGQLARRLAAAARAVRAMGVAGADR